MKEKNHILVRWLPVCLLLCAVIPFTVITVLAFMLPYREIETNRREEYERIMSLNGERIAQHLSCVSDAVTLLMDSEPLRTALKEAAQTEGTLETEDLYFAIGMPISYRNVLSNRAISAVTVYSNGRLAFYSLQQTTTDQALTRCGAMLYNTHEIPEGGSYVVPGTPNGYVYFIREFTDIYDGRPLGQIVIEVESIPTYYSAGEQMPTAYDYQVDLSAYPGTTYYVYDGNGQIVFVDDAQNVGANIGSILPEHMVSGNRVSAEIEGYSVFFRSLYKPTLTAVMLTPDQAITSGADKAQQLFLICAAVVGVLMLVIVWSLSGYIVTPFRALARYCRETKEHPAALPAFEPVFQEVAEVQSFLQARAAQIEDMQSVIMKNHLKMKDNEIQLLQAQINPHFLFNMLDIIGWQAAKDQNPNVSEMVNHLGGLLRNNILLNGKEKITIEQEVQYIKDYLALECIRHAGRFTYSIELEDEALARVYIPKLSVQPIVENCIVHGFHGLRRQGVIEVRIWEDTDGVRCLVKDNGVGFDAEGYFEQAAAAASDSKRSHIALHNIQKRIAMLCGPGYGLEIRSTPGEGTQVMLTLPLDLGEEDGGLGGVGIG